MGIRNGRSPRTKRINPKEAPGMMKMGWMKNWLRRRHRKSLNETPEERGYFSSSNRFFEDMDKIMNELGGEEFKRDLKKIKEPKKIGVATPFTYGRSVTLLPEQKHRLNKFLKDPKFMKEKFKETPSDMPFVNEYKLSDGIILREMDPSVYWFSTRRGPKGQLIMTEPILDIVQIKAKLPSVEVSGLNVTCTGKSLTISAYTERGRYYKELELPIEVYPKVLGAYAWEGVLEITLTKIKNKTSVQKL